MKFTVERAALLNMLQCVGTKHPGCKRRDAQVRLSACAARVFVEANQTTAGTEALVFEEGACSLKHSIFLKVLQTYASKSNMTMEADGQYLKFFSTTLPITGFSHAVTPPGKFQVFPVTDLSVLRPAIPTAPTTRAPVPPPSPEPPPPPAISRVPGTFPVAEDEMHLANELVRLTRRLCALPHLKPEQLVGIAHALFALERLPRITPGVDVEFSVGVRWGSARDYTQASVTCQISDGSLEIGNLSITCDPAVGHDSHSTLTYRVESGGFRSMYAGDDDAWAGIFGWIACFDGYLDENDPADLQVFVADDSGPGFMSPPCGTRNPPSPPPRP